jgi:hypothetical protein
MPCGLTLELPAAALYQKTKGIPHPLPAVENLCPFQLTGGTYHVPRHTMPCKAVVLSVKGTCLLMCMVGEAVFRRSRGTFSNHRVLTCSLGDVSLSAREGDRESLPDLCYSLQCSFSLICSVPEFWTQTSRVTWEEWCMNPGPGSEQ